MRPFRLALFCCLLGTAAAVSQAPEKLDSEKPFLAFDTGGHTALVRRVFLTPDGDQVVTVSADKTVRVWDVLTGEPLRTFRFPVGPGDEGYLEAAALSPDGKQLAVSGFTVGRGKFGIIIYLLSLESGHVEKVFNKGHTNLITALAFSPDGKLLASAASDKTAQVYELKTGRVEKKLEGHTDRLVGIVFSPDGKRLATASADKTGRIWSLASGKTTAELKGHTAALGCIAWSPDGKLLATGGVDGSIKTWDADGTFRKNLDPAKEPIPITSVTFRREPAELLYTGLSIPGRTGLIDLDTGQVRQQFGGHNNAVQYGNLSADGKLAVTTGSNDHETFVWKTEDGTQVQRFGSKGQAVWGVGWSADGTSIAWGNINQGETHLAKTPLERSFDLKELTFGEPPGPTTQRAVLSKGKRALESTKDLHLLIKNGDKATPFKSPQPNDLVFCYTMLDETRAVVGGALGLYLVDLDTNKVLRTYQGHTGFLLGVAPSPDGRFFVSGGLDQTLRIWDPLRDEPLLSLFVAGTEWIAWTPEGYYACSPNGERFMGWVVNSTPEALAAYHPAGHFRKSLYLPEVIKLLPGAGSVAKAVAQAGKDRKQPIPSGVTQAMPPHVAITAPTGPRLTQPKVEVKATAKSAGKNPVTALRLLVDGRPYKGEAGIKPVAKPKLGEVRESWTVELPPGKHTLAVQAESDASKGLSPLLEVTQAGEPADRPALYVVAVGIADYPGKLQLRYAADDAAALAKAFQQRTGKAFHKVEVKVINGKKATRQAILDGLAWLEKETTPQDVAVFAFAGQGTHAADGRYFFLPADADLDNVPKSCLAGEDVKKALAAVPGRLLVLLDCCHTGPMVEADARSPRMPADDLVRDLVSDDVGAIVLCSALGREFSVEERDVQQSVFTFALIQGLSGEADTNSDGIVYLSELERYVVRRVGEMTKGQQHPGIGRPALMRAFPLAVR